ncbi:hypothetical protein AAMO2058_001490900 [Amorphochlora amoebiformis]
MAVDGWVAWDKIEHFGGCLCIVITVYQVLVLTHWCPRRRTRVLTPLVITVSIGGLKEILDYSQWLWYGDPSIRDFVADLLGAVVGLGVVLYLEMVLYPEICRRFIRQRCPNVCLDPNLTPLSIHQNVTHSDTHSDHPEDQENIPLAAQEASDEVEIELGIAQDEGIRDRDRSQCERPRAQYGDYRESIHMETSDSAQRKHV